jgi:hypothetical protein
MLRRFDRRFLPLTRAVAALGAVLVLVLSILAASPDLHERLHGMGGAPTPANHPSPTGQTSDQEDGCIVTLFAQGIVVPLAFFFLALCAWTQPVRAFAAPDRIVPEAPRYLRLPTQAPPLGAI